MNFTIEEHKENLENDVSFMLKINKANALMLRTEDLVELSGVCVDAYAKYNKRIKSERCEE